MHLVSTAPSLKERTGFTLLAAPSLNTPKALQHSAAALGRWVDIVLTLKVYTYLHFMSMSSFLRLENLQCISSAHLIQKFRVNYVKRVFNHFNVRFVTLES